MWGDSSSNIFIVGDYRTGFTTSKTISHFDGQGWSALPGLNTDVQAVWGTKNDVYAVFRNSNLSTESSSGRGVTTKTCAVGIEHYDGSAWTVLACEETAESLSVINQATTSGPASGTFVFVQNRNYTNENALFYHGSQWSSFDLPDETTQWCVGDPAAQIYAASSEGAVYYKKCP
jgi:hypothetical protein